jgi:hypothetical protein
MSLTPGADDGFVTDLAADVTELVAAQRAESGTADL